MIYSQLLKIRLLLTGVLVFGCANAAFADLLVTSRETNSVLRYADDGTLIGTFIAGDPTNLANNDSLNGGLVGPVGLRTRPGDNHLYVVSSGLVQGPNPTGVSRVLKYDLATGNFVGEWGTANLDDSSDIRFDGSGNAYVSNFGNFVANDFHDTIAKFDADGTPAGIFATLPQLNPPNGAGPASMAFGPGGDLFASSFTTSSIFRFDSSGALVGGGPFASSGDIAGASGMLFDGGYLYVTSLLNGRIVRFDVSNPTLSEIFVDPALDGSPLAFPSDMAIAPDGNLLVTSLGSGAFDSGQILKYNIGSGEYMGVFAQGGGLTVPGQMMFTAVPEPSALAMGMAGAGMVGLGIWRRRRGKA